MPLCHLATSPLAYAEEFPLPADVAKLHKPYDMVLGEQPLQVQGFATALTIEQLRTFYEHALPKQGWAIKPLPWLANAQQEMAKVSQLSREELSPQVQEQLAQLNPQRLQALQRQQLHVSRGQEHVLINFSPQGARTLVFLNRWQGDAKSSPWPTTNPCCEGEAAVPPAMRRLPGSIPPYPNGRMFGTGASPQYNSAQGSSSEMYLTSDSVKHVAGFYRQQMAYNGWSAAAMPPAAAPLMGMGLGQAAEQVHTEMLMFRKERAICSIVIAERPAGLEGMSPNLPAASASEQTLIVVTYIESPPLQQPTYVPPKHLLKGQPRWPDQ